ncbi:nuclear transport factor 2 family protein [Streptomyces sp. NPDC020096]
MIPADELSNPAVRTLVDAINSGDREAFVQALTDDPTTSDDGTDADLRQWSDSEIFSSDCHLDVESRTDDGLSLIARFHNSAWGEMRTAWKFTVTDGKISRFDTGRA